MGCRFSTPSAVHHHHRRSKISRHTPGDDGHPSPRAQWSLDSVKLHHALHENFMDNKLEQNQALITDDFMVQLNNVGEVFRGKEGLMQYQKLFKDPFPDLKFTIVTSVVQEERCFLQCQLSGTHLGPLLTPSGALLPTNRSITMSVAELSRFNHDGKMLALDIWMDSGSLVDQLTKVRNVEIVVADSDTEVVCGIV